MAPGETSKPDSETIASKLAKYESFVNERLKVDLQKCLEARDKIYDTISEYLKLKSQIEVIQDNNLQKMKTMVDLGSNFYVQARVPDTTYIYVNVGFGFHLQMTLEEAKAFVLKKEKQLQRQADKYTDEAAKIRARIKMVLEAMSEILQLGGKPEPRLEFW